MSNVARNEAHWLDLSRPAEDISVTAAEVKLAIEERLAAAESLDGAHIEIIQTGSATHGTSVGKSDMDFLARLTPKTINDKTDGHDTWFQLRENVAQALEGNWLVERSAKCLDVTHPDIERPIDVMPCLSRIAVAGSIEFWTTEHHPVRIINYPTEHRLHGQLKNERTDGGFHKFTRGLKTLKNQMVEGRDIAHATAHSYQLECLAYNVPDDVLGDGMAESMRYIATQLETDNPFEGMVVVSERFQLVGPNLLQWHERDAEVFFKRLPDYLPK